MAVLEKLPLRHRDPFDRLLVISPGGRESTMARRSPVNRGCLHPVRAALERLAHGEVLHEGWRGMPAARCTLLRAVSRRARVEGLRGAAASAR